LDNQWSQEVQDTCAAEIVMTSGDSSRRNVNFTKPILHLNPHIGCYVKPHQLQGIRFIWREIIEDQKHQGCILAE
jgi:hypothetical protein